MPDPAHDPPATPHTGTPASPLHRYTARLADEIERRWQHEWERQQAFRAPNPGEPGFDPSKPKAYILDMFPYPSGAGLHVGHPEGYTATDIVARYLRMQGRAVLHPMGWDAFGLPAEQYAVQTNVHPRLTTQRAIDTFRRQLQRFGFSYDWTREVSTIDPGYYKWTQWIWLRMYDAWYDFRAGGGKGAARPIAALIDDLANERLVINALTGDLAEAEQIAGPSLMGGNPLGGSGGGMYRKWVELTDEERRAVIDNRRLAYLGEQTVNWCPALGTVLANEEVIDGRSERGGHPVKRVALKQWMFRITAFAERLLDDLALVDWPESTRTQQADWIGRSEGAQIDFDIEGDDGLDITVFTTRPDTLFGATYLVLAPEHPLAEDLITDARRHDAVRYLESIAGRTDVERQEAREKTGVFTGSFAVNPATGAKIPVWIADYVLMGYGTGAIMAVPAHDERDFEFAKKFGLPIRDVVYTPPLAAIHAFCARHAGAAMGSEESLEMLADFVGLALSRDTRGFDTVYSDVSTRRVACTLDERHRPAIPTLSSLATGRVTAEGLLSSMAGERRGGIAFIWRESLSEVCRGDFSRLADAAREGRLVEMLGSAVTEPGYAVHSSRDGLSIDGLLTPDAKARVIAWLDAEGYGARRVNYKLRDWLFSRQRYWGEPFPVVYDGDGAPCALSPDALPVELPEMADFKPVESDTPTPPLGKALDWVSVEIDGARYRRETNTMPNWAGSCWYYLRYCDPRNTERFVSDAAQRYWLGEGERGGVDLYMGGAEHAVLHLLYARFWHKALYDLGEVSTPEPFKRLRHQGLILSYAYQRKGGGLVPTDEVEETAGGAFVHTPSREPVTQIIAKMSKSLKNVVNPDDVIAEFGADTFRLYEMSMGPIEASKPWNPRDIVGSFRFLQRAWRLAVDEENGASRALPDDAANPDVERALHRAIKKVGADIDALSFNTAIAAMIQFVNDATATGATRSQLARFARILAPFAPHVAEEMWARLGHTSLICHEPWPEHDEAMLASALVEIVVQVNGKVRGRVMTAPDADEDALRSAALADPAVVEALQGKEPRKVIAVKGRLVNLVV